MEKHKDEILALDEEPANDGYSPYDFIFLSRAGFNGMMRFDKKGSQNGLSITARLKKSSP